MTLLHPERYCRLCEKIGRQTLPLIVAVKLILEKRPRETVALMDVYDGLAIHGIGGHWKLCTDGSGEPFAR